MHQLTPHKWLWPVSASFWGGLAYLGETSSARTSHPGYDAKLRADDTTHPGL